MKTNFYLKVNSKGAVSVCKTKPGLNFDQVCISCGLVLPDILFQKPQINATIIVDEKDHKPFILTAETADNVKNAIEAATGIEVKLSFNAIEPD